MSAEPIQAEILEALVAFLSDKFAPDGEAVEATTQLPDHILLDSLAYLEVVVFLEHRFGAQFDAGDLEGEWFLTPAAIAELTSRKLGSQN